MSVRPNRKALGQGDILEPSDELRGVLSQVHPHFLDDKFVHPKFRGFVLISGQDGADARHYQEKQLRNALRQVHT